MTALLITIFILQFLVSLVAAFYCAYLLATVKMQTVFIKNQAKERKRAEIEINKLQIELKSCNNMLITRLGGQTLINPPKPSENGTQKPVNKIVSPSEAISRTVKKQAEIVNPEIQQSLLPQKEKFLADANGINFKASE